MQKRNKQSVQITHFPGTFDAFPETEIYDGEGQQRTQCRLPLDWSQIIHSWTQVKAQNTAPEISIEKKWQDWVCNQQPNNFSI